MMRSSANAGLTPSEVLLFLILLPPYLALAFYFLPTLIYPEKPSTNQVRVAWFLFAGLTAGLGPLVLYWKKVDPWLSAWIRDKKSRKGIRV
jgi:hypothetical protein